MIRCYKQELKTFYNDKKIPQIPPLLVDDKVVTDMKTKADIFNKYFGEQCAPLKNDSKLPSNQMYLTQSRLVLLDFNEDQILKIIRALTLSRLRTGLWTMSKIESLVRGRASPSEVHPGGKF